MQLMISTGRLTLACIVAYIAALPVLRLRLFEISVLEKKVVLADFAFAALLVVVIGSSARRLLPIRRGAVVFSLCPVVALVISGISSGAGANALPDILRAVYSICVFLLFAHFRLTSSESVVVMWSWLVVAVLIALMGFVSFLGVTLVGIPQNPLAYADDAHFFEANVIRISSTLGPNALILYILVAIAFCMHMIGSDGASVRQRRFLQGALVALLLVSVFTISRGIIGLMLSLVLFSYASRHALPALWRVRHALALAAGLLAAAGVFGTTWAVFPVRVDLNEREARLRVEVNIQRSAYHVLHTAALRMFLANPLVGVGPGQFGRHFGAFTTPEERSSAWPPLIVKNYDPHSTWFGWAAKGGIVGLAGWIVLYAWILRQLIKRHPSDGPFNMSRLAGITLIGILLNGFHVEIAHLKFIWAFLGIGMGARQGRARTC